MTLHWFPDGPLVARRARALGVPLVANIIGGPAELLDGGRRIALSRLPRWVKRRAQRFLREWLNRATVVTYTGQATAEWFRSAGVIAPTSVVLHAAVKAPRAAAPSEPRPTDVAFVGRLDRDKRADRLFAVLAILGKRHPTLTAEVIGIEDRHLGALPAYRAARAIMSGGLRTYPRVDRIEDVMQRSKVVLVTSDTEGRTLAALEGMACGAVPVVTDVGDLREAIADGAVGIAVTLGQEEAVLERRLADAVSALLTDPVRRALLAERGYAHVRQEHDPRRTTADWGRILDLAGYTRTDTCASS